MKKRRIAIASLLKPVDDTRAYEKMATTLAGAGHEVYMLGVASSALPNHAAIHFIPHERFPRLSISRLLAPIKIAAKLRKVKPELLIVNTHELLIVAVLNRILFGTRIIYDIQENYYRNILWTDAFPALLRPAIATWVRLKERALSRFFQRFFLAEKSYQNELKFDHDKCVILENKCVLPASFSREPVRGKIQLVFTGTLAESTGVFRSIRLAEKLHKHDSSIHLHIAGYCSRKAEFDEIKRQIDNKPFILLTGGDELVPHAKITEAIASAHFGIISYPPSPHIENRIPTKLYEYLAYRLPVIMEHKEEWSSWLPHHACFEIDFENVHPVLLLRQMQTRATALYPTDEFEWKSEEPKLLRTINRI
jgi:glycosyltransferase involved in cell wall biosynthesis